MNFSVGDVLLNRFRLVEVLRDDIGFSVWIAHDNSLQREYQIFIVADTSVVPRVNAAASYLALSHNPHYTPVLHLHRDGEICVIVSDIDSGITVRDYLTEHSINPQQYPLSQESIRSLIGEITKLASDLDSHDLAHFCINDITVRLTPDGVKLADFPVSSLLKPPVSPLERSTNHDAESIMVYQIAALAFQLLTGTMYTPQLQKRAFSMLQEVHTPHDLQLICTRSLSLEDDNGERPVPLVTLIELLFLLDDWEPLATVMKDPRAHINVSRETSDPSITQAVINRTDPVNLAPIPRSLKEQKNSNDQEKPEWSTSALIFGGSAAVDLQKARPDTDLFHALNELDEDKLNRAYDPYDFNDFDDADTRTAGLTTAAICEVEAQEKKSEQPEDTVAPPSFVPQNHGTSEHNVEHTVLSEEAVDPSQSSPVTTRIEKIEPKPARSGFAQVQGKLRNLLHTRTANVIFAVIIMIAVLGLAIYSLTLGGSSSKDASDPWSTISHEDVRFPGQESTSQEQKKTDQSSIQKQESEKKTPAQTTKKPAQKTQTQSQKSAEPQSKAQSTQRTVPVMKDEDITPVELTSTKSVSQTPRPAGTENTVKRTVISRAFYNRPGGVRGWGYSFTFAKDTKIWRIDLTNQVGGGRGYIYANSSSTTPTDGTQIGTFTFAPDGKVTHIVLRKPVAAKNIVAWIDGTDSSTIPSAIRLEEYAIY